MSVRVCVCAAHGNCGNRISILCSLAMTLSLSTEPLYAPGEVPRHTHTPCNFCPFLFFFFFSGWIDFLRFSQLPVDGIKSVINQDKLKM